jgi:hypothetical protein
MTVFIGMIMMKRWIEAKFSDPVFLLLPVNGVGRSVVPPSGPQIITPHHTFGLLRETKA